MQVGGASAKESGRHVSGAARGGVARIGIPTKLAISPWLVTCLPVPVLRAQHLPLARP